MARISMRNVQKSSVSEYFDLYLSSAATRGAKEMLLVDHVDSKEFLTKLQEIITKLTAKDDKYACAIADEIITESQNADTWYKYFDTFASLLSHPKSLVRNRALNILAANAQWDEENRFDGILLEFLSHVTDDETHFIDSVCAPDAYRVRGK